MKALSKIFTLSVVLFISFVIVCPVSARDLKCTMSRIPMLSESKDKGLLIDLVKAMDEIYTEGSISIEVHPSKRALDKLINGPYDFMVPMLRSKHVNEADLPFALSDVELWSSIFVLYTNKNNTEINPANSGNYKIETEAPLVDFFGFKAIASSGAESSLKKVDIGRIDGYLMAMTETDDLLKKMNLKNIKRAQFDTFGAPIVLKKGPEGKEMEKLLTGLLDQLKENGTYAKIMAPLMNPEYKEW